MNPACFVTTPAWICIACGLINWFLAVRLGNYGRRSSVILWFQIFLITSGLIYMAQGLAGCSNDPRLFLLFMDFYGLGTSLITPTLIVFAVYFVNKDYLLRRLWFLALISSSTLVMLWIFWNGYGSAIRLEDTNLDWGFHFNQSGPLSSVAGAIALAGFIYPISLMLRHLHHLKDPVKKKETRLVITALLVGIIPTLLSDIVIHIFLHGPAILTGPVVTAILASMIYVAMIRYGLHIFNPNNVASSIMEIMPAGLIITDHNNTIQYASTGAEQMLGYQRDQMSGTTLQKLLKSDKAYRTFETDFLHRLDAGEELLAQETVFYRPGGQAVPVSINASIVKTGHEISNRLLAFSDISYLKATQKALAQERDNIERKVVERTRQLSEVQAELEASVSSLPFGFAIINREDQIMFANAQLGKLVGRNIPADPVASRAALVSISEKFSGSIDILANVHAARHRTRQAVKNIEFGPRFYRFFFIPVTRGKGVDRSHVGTVLLMEDTTEEKATQRSRDEFFSIASHELRTPLTAIRGNSQMIQQYYTEQLKDPSLNQMVDDIHGASVRLIDIVNDFLDVSRLEQGRMVFKPEPLNATELIQGILREYDVTSSRSKLSMELIEPATPMMVLADRDRFRQIVVNLVSNALKYTAEGGLKVSLKREAGRVTVSVTDTGQGIPEESQHLLFRKFQQASNNILTRDNTRSTGLGLYISNLMAQGMGGSLYLARTEVGKGSEFCLDLPVAPEAKV